MNKLMGFLELKKIGIPCIPWEEFNENTLFNEKMLYSIRSAVYKGDDINLPKQIGIDGKEGYIFATNLYKKYKDTGMIIYYPYFHAVKSGNIIISLDNYTIEGIYGDLWHLNQNSKPALTITKKEEKEIIYEGTIEFLTKEELNELQKNINIVKMHYMNALLDGKSILLEWSYAQNLSKDNIQQGKPYLIFMEMKTIA